MNPATKELLLETIAYRGCFKEHDTTGLDAHDVIKMHVLGNTVFINPDLATTHFVLVENPDGTLRRKKVFGKIRLLRQNLPIYNSAVEEVLQHKQRRIFQSLKLYAEQMKYFRFKLHMNHV